MATLAELRADLTDRIDETTTELPNAARDRYINHGIRAMYPKVYRTVTNMATVLVADQFEYTLPADFDHAKIIRVEVENESAGGRFSHLWDYEIIPTQSSKIVAFYHRVLPREAGSRIRVIGVRPLTVLVADGDVYDGPPGTEEIPVWYALGLVLSRGIEPRTDYKRYSSTINANGVDIEEMMTAAQFAFGQFELLLERYEMPLPAQAG